MQILCLQIQITQGGILLLEVSLLDVVLNLLQMRTVKQELQMLFTHKRKCMRLDRQKTNCYVHLWVAVLPTTECLPGNITGVLELILYEERSAGFGSEEILDLSFPPFSKKKYSVLLQGRLWNTRCLLFKLKNTISCDVVKCTTCVKVCISA